jgi:hypothetical protein
MPTESKDIQKK